MKPIVQFKPKMFMQKTDWLTLAFAGKLVVVEGWDNVEALLMACDYYENEYSEQLQNLFNKLVSDGAYVVVQVPNRIKGNEIKQYLKDKFG